VLKIAGRRTSASYALSAGLKKRLVQSRKQRLRTFE
jgi:hypothetical protein